MSAVQSFQNTVGKGEIARYEQFLLFLQCLLPVWRTFCRFNQTGHCRMRTLFVWKSLKFVVWERVNFSQDDTILSCPNRKNLQKMKNNMLLETWNLTIIGWKTLWLPACSPLPKMFSTAFFLRVINSWCCTVKGYVFGYVSTLTCSRMRSISVILPSNPAANNRLSCQTKASTDFPSPPGIIWKKQHRHKT